jgi:hypothetical protein
LLGVTSFAVKCTDTPIQVMFLVFLFYKSMYQEICVSLQLQLKNIIIIIIIGDYNLLIILVSFEVLKNRRPHEIEPVAAKCYYGFVIYFSA